MLVILDDGSRKVFRRPRAVLGADCPGAVGAALAAAQRALDQGLFVAGWLAYELGEALEPKLAGNCRAGALLRLGVFAGPDSEAPLAAGRAYAGSLTPQWDRQEYSRAFQRVKALIAAGDIYQANLSFRAHFPFLGEPRALYEGLRASCQAGYCAFVDDGERQILSLSPELFFALDADGGLRAKPMKGTMARGENAQAERARLRQSAKDRAENLMIVDLIRNDLSRIAETGSVTVQDLFQVESYPSLHAMVSTVSAKKRRDVGIADILRALFPCGSVTGAPKIRAMEILRDLESSPRGAYCGAVGYFAPTAGSQVCAQFNVAIRTLTICGGRGELGIGGGVVQDSTAEEEYRECEVKARFFETARRPIQLIETLRYERSFLRLERHLARMRWSAACFGIGFDATAANAALAAVVRRKSKTVLRVRLCLDEEGHFAASAEELAPNPAFWTYRICPQPVHSDDLLLRHKTDWRDVFDAPARLQTDEVVFCNQKGEITEGSRSTIFLKVGAVLLTPPVEAGLLPGVLRAVLLEEGRAREAKLTPADLAGDVFFGNSLRGLIPARRR